ncbi:alpha/beta hydrolase [Quadrisphaera sp. KR29]|uniref:alpha/beta hydrolase n=1 Tax=Quadrisphaera sp. KR29 TaxID=3461391 RepID=UPI0040447016
MVAALAAGLNAWTGYLPSAQAVQTYASGRVPDTDGAVVQVSVPLRPGSGLRPSRTWVYTPPGYDPAGGVRYPVVYLLHGEPGSSADWFSAGDVARTADVLIGDHLIPPVLLVAPDLTAPGTDDTECLDSTRPGGPQVETHVEDVVAWVDAHYATQPDPAHRVVAGMSMGGYCAVDQGLRHQDLYGAIIGLEAFSGPGPGGEAALTSEAQVRAVSPDHYLPGLRMTRSTPVFLDTAEDGDPTSARETDRLVQQLRAKGLPVHHAVEPGQQHDWDFAAIGIAHGLVWTFGQLGLAPTGPPASPDGGAPQAASSGPAGATG